MVLYSRKLVYRLKKLDNIVVPDKVFLAAEVLGAANLFIAAGGTMTNEDALQGTPVIYTMSTQSL